MLLFETSSFRRNWQLSPDAYNQTILWYNGVKSLVTLYYVTLNGPWPEIAGDIAGQPAYKIFSIKHSFHWFTFRTLYV